MAVGVRTVALRKSFGAAPALRELSANFEPGWLHGVIGPDGAGKTTLLRTLMGLLRPDAGRVEWTVDGRPADAAEVRPGLAYMSQQASLYPDLSVREHLEFFRDLYRIPGPDYEERSRRLLRLARLEEFSERKAGRLSGGMYKKLGLICALLRDPAAVLLDEPTNGVDPISRREFWDLLYGLAARRVTVVMTTSYMDEAERCARVHLLDAGRLLACGEPRAVLAERGARDFEEIFLRTGRP